MTINIIKTPECKGQQSFLVVVVPLTCYDYFSFLQMIVNFIFWKPVGLHSEIAYLAHLSFG